MENKLARTDISKETNVHFSVHVPAIVDLTLDVQHKTNINRYRFFKESESIEMQCIKTKDLDCDKTLTTKF